MVIPKLSTTETYRSNSEVILECHFSSANIDPSRFVRRNGSNQFEVESFIVTSDLHKRYLFSCLHRWTQLKRGPVAHELPCHPWTIKSSQAPSWPLQDCKMFMDSLHTLPSRLSNIPAHSAGDTWLWPVGYPWDAGQHGTTGELCSISGRHPILSRYIEHIKITSCVSLNAN